MSSQTVSAGQIVARIAAGVFGGYAFIWGFTTLTIAAALAARLSYGVAQTTAYLLAFLLYLGAFLWAFAARRVSRVWAVLGGVLICFVGVALLTPLIAPVELCNWMPGASEPETKLHW